MYTVSFVKNQLEQYGEENKCNIGQINISSHKDKNQNKYHVFEIETSDKEKLKNLITKHFSKDFYTYKINTDNKFTFRIYGLI